MAYIDTVKQWFLTGKYPTQAQFWQKFAYLRWKDEAIAISEVTSLTTIINELAQPIQVFTTTGGPLTYSIPADFLLEKIIIKPASNTTAYCSSEGGTDGDIVAEDTEYLITVAKGAVWMVNELAIGSARNIYVEGLPSGSTVVFIKRKTVL